MATEAAITAVHADVAVTAETAACRLNLIAQVVASGCVMYGQTENTNTVAVGSAASRAHSDVT
ncbi:hypothetical protein DVS77_28170 [Mycolicibacterium moriokaense]|nr:hypothetical protein DVS77_28170 [Mycolicibacterium moriokaense]